MEERSHTSTHRGHVPRQSSDQRSAVERAPPSLLASLKKIKKNQKNKTKAKVTAVVTDKSPVLQHEHHFQDRPSFTEDWHRFTASQACRSNAKKNVRTKLIFVMYWCVFESVGYKRGNTGPDRAMQLPLCKSFKGGRPV